MLTKSEELVLELTAHGLAADEIAEKRCRSTDTIKKTISNIKAKLKLQKATELTAYYWCRVFGDSFEKRRSAILSILFLVIYSFGISAGMPEEPRAQRSHHVRTVGRTGRSRRNEKNYQHKIAA